MSDQAKRRPAFQFYPGDWRKDVELRSCSLAARGLWIDLMCVAHDCEPYGHLMLNGRPMTPAQMAGQIGVTPAACVKLLEELLANGVARKNAEGAIYSKRMVDDENIRSVRAEGGKAGAEHGSKGGSHGIKGGRPKADKGGFITPLVIANKPPPSSSSSSSTEIPSEPKGSGAGAPPVAPPAPSPMSDEDKIYTYGVPLLVNAGSSDKHARSFLGGLIKAHEAPRVVEGLRECIKAKPLQPLEWLAKAMPPAPSSRHVGFQTKDYRQGVTADGSLA